MLDGFYNYDDNNAIFRRQFMKSRLEISQKFSAKKLISIV